VTSPFISLFRPTSLSCSSIKRSSLSSLHLSLLRDQPQIFTTDWRRKISTESFRLLSSLALSVGISTPLTDLFLNSFTNISLVPNSSASSFSSVSSSTSTQQSFVTDDVVLRTTRMALISLCKAVNTTYRVELHSLILLQR
jgi:hypothetical protein